MGPLLLRAAGLAVLLTVSVAGPACAQLQVREYQTPIPQTAPMIDDLSRMTDAQVAELSPFVNGFFERLKTGRTREAYDWLIADSPIGKQSGIMDQLVSMTGMVFDAYGALTRWEYVHSACLTAEVCRVLYVAHTPTAPVFYTFYVYRRQTGWGLLRVNFTDQPTAIF